MTFNPFSAAFGTVVLAGVIAVQSVQTQVQQDRGYTMSEDIDPQPTQPISSPTPSPRDPRTRTIGKRLERNDVADRIVPTARLQTRVRSRIQNRLRTRIDPTYVPQDTTSPYAVAEDQARDTGSRRGVRPR